jgi:hypothetical protein
VLCCYLKKPPLMTCPKFKSQSLQPVNPPALASPITPSQKTDPPHSPERHPPKRKDEHQQDVREGTAVCQRVSPTKSANVRSIIFATKAFSNNQQQQLYRPTSESLLWAGFCEQKRFVKVVVMVIVRFGDLVACFVHAVLN